MSDLIGTEKSTIARTVACHYFDMGRLGASFFLSRGGGDIGLVDKFITTIAVQLAHYVPPLQRYICEAVVEQSHIARQCLHDQWRQLVLIPLSKLNQDSCPSYVLVVDVLDGYKGENNIQIILQLLAEVRSLTMVQLRVFLTSRLEIPIRHGFRRLPHTEHQDFILHSISAEIVAQDISIFLEFNLRLIGQE